jgi:hypothetical protein
VTRTEARRVVSLARRAEEAADADAGVVVEARMRLAVAGAASAPVLMASIITTSRAASGHRRGARERRSASGATTKGVREWKNVALNNPLFDEGLILPAARPARRSSPSLSSKADNFSDPTSRPLLFAHNAKSQSRGERVPFGRVRVCRPVDDDPTRHVDIAEEC